MDNGYESFYEVIGAELLGNTIMGIGIAFFYNGVRDGMLWFLVFGTMLFFFGFEIIMEIRTKKIVKNLLRKHENN